MTGLRFVLAFISAVSGAFIILATLATLSVLDRIAAPRAEPLPYGDVAVAFMAMVFVGLLLLLNAAYMLTTQPKD